MEQDDNFEKNIEIENEEQKKNPNYWGPPGYGITFKFDIKSIKI